MRTTFPLILLLSAGIAQGAPPETPKKSCNDPIPKECTKTQFLGDENDCSCFVCNPGTKTRKVVCTNDDAAKKALRKLGEGAPAEKPGGAATGAPR